MQQFSRAICKAVLTNLPSRSACLFNAATRPKGMAKEPVSGMMDIVTQTCDKGALLPTTKAAKMLATAPTKMHGEYSRRGRRDVFTSRAIIVSDETSCNADLVW